jgi:hypothetical protein
LIVGVDGDDEPVVVVAVVVVSVGVVVVDVVSVVVGVVSVDDGVVVVVVVELVSVGGGVVSVVPDDETADVSVDELPVPVMSRTAPKPPDVRNPAMNRATKIRAAHDFLLGPPSFANGAISRSPRSWVQSRRTESSSGSRLAYKTSPVRQFHVPVALPQLAAELPHSDRAPAGNSE